MHRAVVIGLDGATWSVLDPLLQAGTMPALASLLDRSARGTLRSTVPPYTPPAWTSAVTGVNPGRHGIFGFVQGRREPRLAHWGLVRAPALWDHVRALGGRTGLFHLPLTYPPPRVEGWAVGAVWMPTSRGVTGFTRPPALEGRIRALVPDYAPVSGVELFEDWRDPALAGRIASTLRQRRTVLADLLDRDPVDLVWAVLEAPDRLHHAYYKYLDPAEPMSATPAAAAVRGAAAEAFAEVDRIVALLDRYAGDDGVALVCSDHGATGWDGSVHGNVLLERAGLLRLRPAGRLAATLGAGRLGPLARRVIPARLTYRARRRVQAMFDPGRTAAYTARLGSQGFSVNLAGREPSGTVPPERFEDVLARLERALRDATTPGGAPLVQAVHRREELYAGPEAGEAPDLVVETAGWRWEVSDAVGDRRLHRDLSGLPLGCHHPDGILALRAPDVAPAAGIGAGILDVAPTLLHAAGAPVPEGLDGQVRVELFGPSGPPVRTAEAGAPPPGTEPGADRDPYTPEEEALITRYLADLGYL